MNGKINRNGATYAKINQTAKNKKNRNSSSDELRSWDEFIRDKLIITFGSGYGGLFHYHSNSAQNGKEKSDKANITNLARRLRR